MGGQYLHSGDGGTTWDAPFTFFQGSIGITAFPAYTGCVLHIIYANNADHRIYYMRNPTGNAGHCMTTIGTIGYASSEQVSVYPNPFSTFTTLQISPASRNSELILINMFGQNVRTVNIPGDKMILDRGNLSPGIYFFKLSYNHEAFAKGKIMIVDR